MVKRPVPPRGMSPTLEAYLADKSKQKQKRALTDMRKLLLSVVAEREAFDEAQVALITATYNAKAEKKTTVQIAHITLQALAASGYLVQEKRTSRTSAHQAIFYKLTTTAREALAA